jgi:hypothetical protein
MSWQARRICTRCLPCRLGLTAHPWVYLTQMNPLHPIWRARWVCWTVQDGRVGEGIQGQRQALSGQVSIDGQQGRWWALACELSSPACWHEVLTSQVASWGLLSPIWTRRRSSASSASLKQRAVLGQLEKRWCGVDVLLMCLAELKMHLLYHQFVPILKWHLDSDAADWTLQFVSWSQPHPDSAWIHTNQLSWVLKANIHWALTLRYASRQPCGLCAIIITCNDYWGESPIYYAKKKSLSTSQGRV